MLKLVLSTILMTLFITGCDSRGTYSTEGIDMRKAGDAVAFSRDDNKTTPNTRPEYDYDNLNIPSDPEVETPISFRGEERVELETRIAEAEEALRQSELRNSEASENRDAAIELARQEGIETGLETVEEASEELKSILEETRVRADEAEAEVLRAQEELDALLTQRRVEAQKAQALSADLAEATSSLEASTAELTNLRNEIQENEALIIELETNDANNEQITKLREDNISLQAKINELETVIAGTQNENSLSVETEDNQVVPSNDSTNSNQATQTTPTEVLETSSPDLPPTTSVTNTTTTRKTLDEVFYSLKAGEGATTANTDIVDSSSTLSPSAPAENSNEVPTEIAVNSEAPTDTVASNETVDEMTGSSLVGLFTPEENGERKGVMLTFSAIPGTPEEVVDMLSIPFLYKNSTTDGVTKIPHLFPTFVSECENGLLTDFSGWVNLSTDKDESLRPCSYKIINFSNNSNQGDIEFSLVQPKINNLGIAEEGKDAIASLVSAIRPHAIAFHTVLEEEDLANFNNEASESYNRLMSFHLTARSLQMKRPNDEGINIPYIDVEDGSCFINVYSKTLTTEDFNTREELRGFQSQRCGIRVTPIEKSIDEVEEEALNPELDRENETGIPSTPNPHL